MALLKRRDSLATDLALLMLMVVMVSVTIVSAVSLAGVFDLASRQAAARQVAYKQALAAELRARLDGAEAVAARSASILSDAVGADINRPALAMQYDAGIEFVDRIVVAAPDGTVLSSYPTFQAPRDVSGTQYLEAATSEEPTFVYVPQESNTLWIAQVVETGGGERVVLVRVRTAFLDVLVEEFSSPDEGRIALVTDDEATLVIEGPRGPRIDLETLTFSPLGDLDSGSVSAQRSDAVALVGRYTDVTEYPGIRWHVAVLEPRLETAVATWRALAPATAALVITGALSVFVSFLFARRQVAPITHLEELAREAVTGAFVRPIEVDRTDELGRMADAFNAMAGRLNSLHDLAQLLASSSSLDQVLDGIMTAMGHIVDTEKVAVFLLESESTRVVLARSRGLGLEGEMLLPAEESGWVLAAMHAGGPVSLTGSAESSSLEATPALVIAGVAYETALAAPLMVGGEPLGVVVVVESERREFTEAEVELLRTFSAQAAVAVNNSRLFLVEIESRREAEALRDIAERLATPKDLERSFASVMDIACTLFGVPEARIGFVDRPAYGLAPAEDPLTERVLLRAWESVWAASGGDTFALGRRGDDDSMDRLLDDLDVDAAYLLTVTREGDPGAVVALASTDPDRIAGARMRGRAAALGNELALALDNAFYFAQARSRAANLETIFRISQAVSSSLQIKVVLNRVLDVVQKIFSADAVSLMEYDEARQIITTAMARGLISNEILHYECKPGEDVPGRVFSGGEPIKIDDLSLDSGGLPTSSLEQGLTSLLSVPLLARGRSLGVLTIFSVQVGAFSDEDMGLLHTFASQAALAIDTADLYGKEHHVASVLQASILPQNLPDYAEIEAASVYLPAGHEAEIGGDYFDLFRAPDGQIVMAIGDVCGKGIEAATKTSMIKFSVRALVAAGLGPAAVLAEVNRMIAETGRTSDIVTLWVGLLDAATGRLRYANGGHPPALVRTAADHPDRRLATTGPLLGALMGAEYDEEVTELRPDEIVLLYTDGVTEARRGNKFFGEGRVRRALTKASTAAEAVDGLLSALDVYVPGNLRDDAAVLAIRLREREMTDGA